ncbi:hypothetical protein Bca52824_059370 [Brassica carinata]|uniref:Uncharacterized protein n=1 Tax=Brassica carinata TaxID=52824 RepID=A0A8X7QUA8_BRACI|nr:hypothetical protein Bca52824_059370 [Brassica carinata]
MDSELNIVVDELGEVAVVSVAELEWWYPVPKLRSRRFSVTSSPSRLTSALGLLHPSNQAWLVVVIEFVFRPAAPDSPSATPILRSDPEHDEEASSQGGFRFVIRAIIFHSTNR